MPKATLVGEIAKRPGALSDLSRHASYLEEHGGLEVAERFLNAVEDAFERLSGMPTIGRRREISDARLVHLRHWSIRGFDNYLIFYFPTDVGIEVLRVLHGARDIDQILEAEPADPEIL